MRARFKNTAASAGNGIGLLFGYANPSNFNVANIDTVKIEVYSVVGGSATFRGVWPALTIANGVDHEIVIERDGATVVLTLDGVEFLPFNVPANLTSTKHGFYHYGNCAGEVDDYGFY